METWHPGSCWAEVSGTALWTTWKAPCVTQTMPGISDMKRDQCMIHYDTVWDRHHLFAIIPHIFPRSRSFFMVELWLGWHHVGSSPGPNPLVDDIIFAIEKPCRSRWICHPKNHKTPRIQQEKVFAYLFHLVSSENMLQKSSSLMS